MVVWKSSMLRMRPISIATAALLVGCAEQPDNANQPATSKVVQQQPSEVPKPSFDCSKAAKPQEKLICTDGELAKLDTMLSEAYKAAAQSNGKASILQAQRQWIKQSFNSCTDKPCLVAAYQTRIAELQGGQSSSAATAKSERGAADSQSDGSAQAATMRNSDVVLLDGNTLSQWRRMCRTYSQIKYDCASAASPNSCIDMRLGDLALNRSIYDCDGGEPPYYLLPKN